MKTIEVKHSTREAPISEHPEFHTRRAEWGVIPAHFSPVFNDDGDETGSEWTPENRTGHRPELDGMSLADMWDAEKSEWRIQPPGLEGIVSFLKAEQTITVQFPPPAVSTVRFIRSWPECGFTSPHVKCPDCNWKEYRENLVTTKGVKAWLDLRIPREDYPLRTVQDLEIADLKRENNAAFEVIQELSQALVDLGFDPTAKVAGAGFEPATS